MWGKLQTHGDKKNDAEVLAIAAAGAPLDVINGSVNSMTLPVCFHTAGMSARYAGTGQIGNRTPVRFATHC